MMEQLENPTKWYEGSAVLIKLGVIAIIILALMIPSSWILDLIHEREGYQQQNIDYVSDKWAGSQLVQGPVLAVPYRKQVSALNHEHKMVTHEVTKILYILPQNLQITADVKTELFQHGVYDATVYTSSILLQGAFNKPDPGSLGIDSADLLYDQARLVYSLSDLKGLKNTPMVTISGRQYTPEPVADGHIPFDKGLQIHFPLQKDQGFNFDYRLELKGSNELNFLHLGKTTDVAVTSNWTTPAFNGRYLPDSRPKAGKGFGAKWHMVYYNRPYPQQWINDDSVLVSPKQKLQATFGVKLQVPIDQYRKILRTTKYSTLIILLTFVSLFLTEMIRKQRVHLFNYALIGAAMVVYYTLLLSFAEQMGYNLAYLIASVSTITLITLFTGSLLNNSKAAALFAAILTLFYGFIFVIIQLEELALLVGSVALFIVVAALMYFSRKINWDQH